MVSQIISSLYFVGAIIISCFVVLSLCNTFDDENPIELVSDGLNDIVSSDDFSIIHDGLSQHRLFRYSINSIYQFGDSLSDTGNYIWEDPYSSFGQRPYGETYFNKRAGRGSDGLLIIDFIAAYLRKPFLDPYLNTIDGDFTHGANFAVIGATALDISVLAAKDIIGYVTNHSLSVQLEWFKLHINSRYSDATEAKEDLANALFVMGEIGGNDYNFALSAGKSPEVTYGMVAEVVQAISNAVEEVISVGATKVIVPGNLPMGCMTLYQAWFKTNDATSYDELKCFKPLNDFATYHNDQVRDAIQTLRIKYPHVQIVYMDLYGAMSTILRFPTILGFDKKRVFKACCGGGDEEFNFNSSKLCGTEDVKTSCRYPLTRLNWDGFHLTHHAYNVMANLVIAQMFYPYY